MDYTSLLSTKAGDVLISVLQIVVCDIRRSEKRGTFYGVVTIKKPVHLSHLSQNTVVFIHTPEFATMEEAGKELALQVDSNFMQQDGQNPFSWIMEQKAKKQGKAVAKIEAKK